jgi:hypothetical protein
MRRRFIALACALGAAGGFFGLAANTATAESLCVHVTVSVEPFGKVVDHVGACVPDDLGLPPLPLPMP